MNTSRRLTWIMFIMLLASLLAANVTSAQEQTPEPAASTSVPLAEAIPLPAPTGPYQVGVEWRYWVDQSRDETFDSTPHGKREMMVKILYPMDTPNAQAASAPYIEHPDAVLPAFSEIMTGVGITVPLQTAQFATFQTHSLLNQPLSKKESSYPVLVFSHGAGGEASMYTAQLEELASHGYIIAAIDHAYGAAAVVYPDGRTVTANFSTGLDGAAPIWAQDQIFVINQLEALNTNDPENRFTHRLDLNRLGVFGHSLGGAAASYTCLQDARCKVGANEDGPVYGDVITQGLKQPFMYLLSDTKVFSNPDFYQKSTGPLYLLFMHGYEHLNFGDWPLWETAPAIRDQKWLGSVDGLHSVEATRAYLLAFFDKYLKGDAGTLLDGPSADYPEVTVAMQHVES